MEKKKNSGNEVLSFTSKTRVASFPNSTLLPDYLCQVILKVKYKSDIQPN